jgi:putative glutamine amidotransferase
MLRIGLTYTGSDEKHDNYARWLQGEDAEIEIVRLDAGGSLSECDALVLSGGVDVHPDLYGGAQKYPGAGEWRPKRDAFEAAALRSAFERGLPVLGVCRGLQLINVVLRGNLTQDLGEKGDTVHEAKGEDKQHGVVVEEGSLLREMVGAGRGLVNSAHHQAIGNVGEGLRVNCRADDGTIEGIEWAEPAGRSFLLAVQWHPERMYVNGVGDVPFYRAIREEFVKAIKDNHANH